MIIKNAQFVMSNQDVAKCPPPNKPEYAFIGRSNVGKSSLINMLCQQNKLAKISSTPGKTQLINHFLINNNWYLVDLPGYGYAKITKTKKEKFNKMTLEYLKRRENLLCLFILIDCRIPPQEIDLTFIREMGETQMPFAIVFTKTDKLSSNILQKNIQQFKSKLLEEWEALPETFISSATKYTGQEEILSYINQINKKWENPKQ